MERLPDIVPVAPAITKNELQFDWNHEEVKTYLKEVTEKYAGLVVTEENLPDMEKARREITSFRTAITRFKQDGKRKLKAPAERFARECDDLLKVVEDVEGPIAVQLARYEAARKNELREEIITEYQMKASAMGLDMDYWQLDIADRWLNRTQKWSDTCCAIDSLIKQQLEQQKAVEARADAIKIKKAYAQSCVEMENQRFALKTPLELEEVYPGIGTDGFDVEGTPMETFRAMAEEAARARHDLEEAARAEPAENVPILAQEEPAPIESEITHEEPTESSKYVIDDSTMPKDGERPTYLAITISFTAQKYAEKEARDYVKWLENDICNHGAFPVVTIEEKEVWG